MMVSGANLKQRIEVIMAHRIIHRLSLAKKLLVAAAAFAAVAGPIVLSITSAPALRAQSAAPLAFEVASVKPYVQPAGVIVISKLYSPPLYPFASRVAASRRRAKR
jgi:hypothetical protein